MTREGQLKTQATEEERAMLMSGSLHQNVQYAPSPKTPEPSALAALTKRLHSQLVAAQSIENGVESIARRLGGSAPNGVGEAMCEDASGQIITPRIDEMNGLIDLLAKTLARTEDEVQRLRRMVE